jgi:hypothetical protein
VIGEGLAHLNRLVATGVLLRETGADGLPRYRRAPEADLPHNPA